MGTQPQVALEIGPYTMTSSQQRTVFIRATNAWDKQIDSTKLEFAYDFESPQDAPERTKKFVGDFIKKQTGIQPLKIQLAGRARQFNCDQADDGRPLAVGESRMF